jgi:hypothetical protein
MKYRYYLVTLAAATILTACGGNDTGEEMTFESVKVEKTVSITNEPDAPQCKVSLQLAAVKGGPAERAKAVNEMLAQQLLGIEGVGLKVAADSFANKYTGDYIKNFAPLYREDRNDKQKRAWYEYHYNITSDTKKGRGGVTIYSATIDYYEGGAHGINQRLAMNFDNATGQLLMLDDVFVPGYQQQLSERLLQALMEKAEAKDVADLKDMGYLYATDMFASENFALGDDAITFVYNPYEIAPYAFGLIELEIDNDDLKELWK